MVCNPGRNISYILFMLVMLMMQLYSINVRSHQSQELVEASALFDIESANHWLSEHQIISGEVSSETDLVLGYQATGEALRAQLGNLDVTFIDHGAALTYLNQPQTMNIELLSRKIIVNALAGASVSEHLQALLERRNQDGGFADYPGYHSTAFDTALALEALFEAGFTDAAVIGGSINYLLESQDVNGSFPASISTRNSVFVTAQVIQTLQRMLFAYNISASISQSIDYLYANQLSDGSWGSDWETAQVLLALVPVTTDPAKYLGAVEQLQLNQESSGSWLGDVYSTSLVLRAVHLLKTIKYPKDPSKAVVRGRLVDDENAQPLLGINVEIAPATVADISINTDGSFQVEGLDVGDYTFKYSVPGYLGLQQNISVVAGQLVDVGILRMRLSPTTAIISGVISDVDTGLGVLATVDVSVANTTQSVNTDAKGAYSLVIAPGAAAIKVRSTDYLAASATANVTAGANLNFSPTLKKIDINVLNSSISGVIIDNSNQLPLAGVTVTDNVSANSAITGVDGRFLLTGLSAGEKVVHVSASSYQSISFSLSLGQNFQANVGTIPLSQPEANTDPNKIGSTITGSVQDVDSGLPLAGVAIAVTGTTVSTLTNQNGEFVLDELNAGEVNVTMSLSGYESVGFSLQLAEKIQVNVGALSLHQLQSSASITGMIIEQGSNLPLDGVLLSIEGLNKTVLSAGDGQFELSDLATGNYTVSANKAGYRLGGFTLLVSESANINVGTIELVKIEAQDSVTLQGYIRDVDSGLAIVGAKVFAAGLSITADTNGFYQIDGIESLDFVVQASADGYAFGSMPVMLSQFTTTVVDLTLQRTAIGGVAVNKVKTDKPQYSAYQPVIITGEIANQTIREKSVRLYTLIKDADGNELERFAAVSLPLIDEFNSVEAQQHYKVHLEEALEVLAPQETREVELEMRWNTQRYGPGTYYVVVQALDGVTSQLLSEFSAPVVILPTESVVHVIASASPDFSLLDASAELALSVDILNRSNIATEINLAYAFKAPSGELIADGQLLVSLQPDEVNKTVQLTTLPYVFSQSGVYPVALTVNTGVMPSLLQTGQLFVPPTVRLKMSNTLTPQVVIPAPGVSVRQEIEVQGVSGE